MHCPIRRDAPRPSHHSTLTPDVTPDPQPFSGDYFGNDYGEEDFPDVNNDGPVHIDVHHDMNVAEQDDNAPETDNEDTEVDLSMGWEPPRNLERNVRSPTPEVGGHNSQPSQNSRLDEGEHEQLRNAPVTIEHFGGKAGAPLHDVPQVKISEYTHYSVDVEGSAKNPWAPFNSQMDWEVAQWAKLRGPGSTAFTDLLTIEGVCEISFAFLACRLTSMISGMWGTWAVLQELS